MANGIKSSGNSYKGYYGILKGVVTRSHTEDPKNLERIQVWIPSYHGGSAPKEELKYNYFIISSNKDLKPLEDAPKGIGSTLEKAASVVKESSGSDTQTIPNESTENNNSASEGDKSTEGFYPWAQTCLPLIAQTSIPIDNSQQETVGEPTGPSKTVSAQFTAYYPSNDPMEGGLNDRLGKPLNPANKTCAAPKSLSLGTKVKPLETGTSIDNQIYTVNDRGGAIKIVDGVYHIDILMSTKEECNNFGRVNGKLVIYGESDDESTTSTTSTNGRNSINTRSIEGAAKEIASSVMTTAKNNQPSPDSMADLAINIITKGEGTYDTINGNDNGAISIGKFQWHGDRAKNLLIKIKDKNSSSYTSIMSSNGANVNLNISWKSFKVSKGSSSYNGIKAVLQTNESKTAQDETAREEINGYFANGQKYGITDSAALLFYADLYNQSPASAQRIAKNCPQPKNLDNIYNTSLKDSVLGKYSTRRTSCYNNIKTAEANGWVLPISSAAGAVGGSEGVTATKVLPSVGDTVWLMFEGGDIRYPVYMGCLGSTIKYPEISSSSGFTADSSGGLTKFGYGQFLWPVSQQFTRISAGYGIRVKTRTYKHKPHSGIDIPVSYGSPIYSVADGTVLASGNGYGTHVKIDHGGGVVTLYGHLKKKTVTTGQKVTAGQQIGEGDNTGQNTTGSHLHFEVRVNGKAVDPTPYLGIKNDEGTVSPASIKK